jgi:hypothetical protein
METITIQVPPEIAQAYSNVSSYQQSTIQRQILELLESSLKYSEILAIMDELSAEAQANGLTPEILESILNE